MKLIIIYALQSFPWNMQVLKTSQLYKNFRYLKIKYENLSDKRIKRVFGTIICYNCINEVMFEKDFSVIGYVDKNEYKCADLDLINNLHDPSIESVHFKIIKVQYEDDEEVELTKDEIAIYEDPEDPNFRYEPIQIESIENSTIQETIGCMILFFLAIIIMAISGG